MWETTIPACICEGGAEKGILELLLDHDKLIFSWENLLSGEIIMKRDAKSFQDEYLRMDMDKKVVIYRILDSRRENFKLSPAYADKVIVYNVVTAPEIEMLYIISEGKYKDFKKSGCQKPSDYCKQVLKKKEIKKKEFVKNYFKDIHHLMKVLKEYKSIAKVRKGEMTIYDLLKKE